MIKPAPLKVSYPHLEEEILRYWNENKIFQKSLDKNRENPPYLFYDGPPFATGMPHYGHILTSYAKDTVPRYFTMKGYFVDRRWGWDCHGLPVEYEVEKLLGINGKTEIERYGVEKFNATCRSIVLKYADEWEKIIHRIGRWVDFKRQYKTMDSDFMESVMWVFGELVRKRLVYESPRVVAYCNRCMTSLSNFETGLDDAFRERDDMSITVIFQDADDPSQYYTAWTTTPWTLPSNMALAVNEEITYAQIKVSNTQSIWMAEDRMDSYARHLPGNSEIITTLPGKALLGRCYIPVFPYYKDTDPKAHRILSADFIDLSMGTGIVHIAPAFGEDDYQLCFSEGIEVVDPVSPSGKFQKPVHDFEGKYVFAANRYIVRKLRDKGCLVTQENYRHKYPHCWRCDSPLIYRTINSWYIKVADFQERLLANNEEINWVPKHIGSGRFKQWIANARDWCVSRNRFWGTPIPIWRCTACDNEYIIDSKAILETHVGQKVKDLHRPYCDELSWACDTKGCEGRMERVKEVFDCWFESGAMPYAQVHYPFEKKESFETIFPSSFIVEYVAQTRGWFYTLLVEGTLLFNASPFKNAICHGVILAEDGRKMSKRLKNFPDPLDVIEKHGSDALRIYLLSSPVIRGLDVRFTENDVKESVRRFLLPYWNVFHFFTSYASLVKDYVPELIITTERFEDRHILSELEKLKRRVSRNIEAYELPGCYQEIQRFIETLSGWYIRLNRQRFWTEEITKDAKDALNTLFTVLNESSRVFAPFIPFTMEHIYKHMTGQSVHLSGWPEAEKSRIDKKLESEIDIVREVIECGRSLRERHQIGLRQPLQRIRIGNVDQLTVSPYDEIIKAQLNVKEIVYHLNAEDFAKCEVSLDAKKLGPIFREKFTKLIKLAKSGSYTKGESDVLEIDFEQIPANSYQMIWKSITDNERIMSTDALVVALETTITHELRVEGTARLINRLIQDQRKALGFSYEQRIILQIEASDLWKEAIEHHQSWLIEQTLADRLTLEKVDEAMIDQCGENGTLKIIIQPLSGL